MPVVSVIMVSHRDTPHLRSAIASVLEQTWRDLELVLVDNGTGLEAERLGELGADARLRWVRLPENRGIPAGHNAGVAAARGEFIALHDYDDLSVPDRIERQVAALRAESAVGLVSGLAQRIDAEGRETGRVFCLTVPEEHGRYAPYAAPLVTPAAMGRSAIFRTLPYRAEFPFAGDLDFQARVAERWPMRTLPAVLLRYRWYPGQTTQQRLAAIEQSRCAIQILAGRRRAGRPEDLAHALAATAAPAPAETWRRGARLCVAESQPVFAAYQARRSLAWDRSVRGTVRALGLLRQAVGAARGSERELTVRMFFTGPVRALGLHPVA